MFRYSENLQPLKTRNEINDNKQVNWESVIFQVMGTSTCYFLLIIYSSFIPYKATSQTDEEINSLIWLSLSRDSSMSLSFCLCFCLCLSLYLSLVSPWSFLSWYIPVFRDEFLLWFFISDTWSLHLLTPTPSYHHTQSCISTCVCAHLSHAAARITHPLSQEKRQGKN